MNLPLDIQEIENFGITEFDGPIDGIRPEDYPETYELFLNCICYTSSQRWFYFNTEDTKLLCVSCFNTECSEVQNRFQRTEGWHTITTFPREIFCQNCETILLLETLANECTECIEEWLENSEKILIGEEVNVITRW